MASVRKYYDKDGKLVSIQLRAYRGTNETGGTLPAYRKTVKIPEGITPRQLEKLVQKEMVLFEEACKKGEYDGGSLLFRDYAKQFMETKAVAGLADSTLSHYQDMLDNRILPCFGHKKMRDITGKMIDQFYKELLAEGQNKRTGKPLSPKTVLEHHRLLSNMFSQAKKQHIVSHNPAEDATPPKTTKTLPNYYQPEQLARIRKAFDKEPIRWKLMGYLWNGRCERGRLCGGRPRHHYGLLRPYHQRGHPPGGSDHERFGFCKVGGVRLSASGGLLALFRLPEGVRLEKS